MMCIKIFAVHVIRFVLKVFYVFPVKNDRVMFCSHTRIGKQLWCNPKYVYLYLKSTYGNQFEYVLVDTSYKEYNEVQKVSVRSIKFIYYMLTSKVCVNNNGCPVWLPFRKDQFIINTWHGVAYKTVGQSAGVYKTNMGITRIRSDFTSLFLSSSRNFTKGVIRDSFLYDGEVLEIGMPRNDVLLYTEMSQLLSKKVRSHYNISHDIKIVLWAPTYRGNDRDQLTADNDFLKLKVKRVLSSLKKRFSGEWCVFYRFHYYTNELEGLQDKDIYAIDVTRYEDMQELLCAADILITDYSSSMWDFSLTGKPGFLYVPDLQRYEEERGLETPIETWPYPYAKDNDELEKIILEYDPVKSKEKIKAHHELSGICETGRAAELVCDRIYKECFSENK